MTKTTNLVVLGLLLILTLIILAGNCRSHRQKIGSDREGVNISISQTDGKSDLMTQVNIDASISGNSVKIGDKSIKEITPAIHDGCNVKTPAVLTGTLAVPAGVYIKDMIESSILDALGIHKSCIKIISVDKYDQTPSIIQISVVVEEEVIHAMQELFDAVLATIQKILHFNHSTPSEHPSDKCTPNSIKPLEIKPLTCCLADPGDLSDKPPYHSCGRDPMKSTTTPVIIPQTSVCGSGTAPSQWCNRSMDQFIKLSQKYTKDGWDSPESAPWLEWAPTRSPFLYSYSNPSADLAALVIGGATNVDFPPQLINDVTNMLMHNSCRFYVYMAQVDLSMLPKWFATPCNIYHSLLLFVDADKQQKEAEEIDPANIVITLELWANGSLEMALAPPLTTPSPQPGGKQDSPHIDVSKMTKNQIVAQAPQLWGCTAAQFHKDVYQRFWYLGEMPDSSNLKDLVEEAQRWVKKNPGYSVLTLTPEPCETKQDWYGMSKKQQDSIVRSVQCDAFVQNMLWYMMNSTTFQTPTPRFIPISLNLYDTLKWNDVELVGNWEFLSSENWSQNKNGWIMSDESIVTRQDIQNWRDTVNVKIPELIDEAKQYLAEAKLSFGIEGFNLSSSSIPVCNEKTPCDRPNTKLTDTFLSNMLHHLDSHSDNSVKTTKGGGWGIAGRVLNMIANAVLSHFLTAECVKEM